MSKLPMTPEVAAMRNVNIQGNIIPVEWYKTILKESGKPDLVAIQILADIVYWYRPTVIRDEVTGAVIAYQRKFKGDYLQKTYKSYADMFGLSEYQVKEAIVSLEKKYGVIKRDFKTLHIGDLILNNVLYLILYPERLSKITVIADENLPTPMGNFAIEGGADNLHTNTYTIPETITNTTTHKSREAKAPLSCATDENFDKFWSMYLKKSGKKDALKAWRKIKPEMHTEILDKLEMLNRVVYGQRAIQYVPMPATWLNGERWNDNPIPEAGCMVKPQSKPALFNYDNDEPVGKNVHVVGQK